jgi:hypothetical protein
MRSLRLLVLLMLKVPLAFAQEIHTDQLTVGYDAASGTFSATDRTAGRRFIKHGRLDRVDPGSAAVVKDVTDPTFGPGSQLVIEHAGEGETKLEVYPALPLPPDTADACEHRG